MADILAVLLVANANTGWMSELISPFKSAFSPPRVTLISLADVGELQRVGRACSRSSASGS